jgi:hypothetical protein
MIVKLIGFKNFGSQSRYGLMKLFDLMKSQILKPLKISGLYQCKSLI